MQNSQIRAPTEPHAIKNLFWTGNMIRNREGKAGLRLLQIATHFQVGIWTASWCVAHLGQGAHACRQPPTTAGGGPRQVPSGGPQQRGSTSRAQMQLLREKRWDGLPSWASLFRDFPTLQICTGSKWHFLRCMTTSDRAARQPQTGWQRPRGGATERCLVSCG